MITNRLKTYFQEAHKHIELIEEADEVLESINLFVQKSGLLIEISDRLEQKYNEIKQKRDNHN